MFAGAPYILIKKAVCKLCFARKLHAFIEIIQIFTEMKLKVFMHN